MPFRQKRLLLAVVASVVALAGVPLFMAGTAQQARATQPAKAAHPAKTAEPAKTASQKKAFDWTKSARPANSRRDYWHSPGLNVFATMALDGFEEALVSDETYGGVEIRRPGVRFYYVGEPSPGFIAKLAALPKALDWDLRKVPNSYASLTRLTRQIDADSAMWTSKGVTLSTWGPDVRTNVVSLTLAVSDVSYRLQASKLLKAYGKEKLEVAAEPTTIMPAADAAG